MSETLPTIKELENALSALTCMSRIDPRSDDPAFCLGDRIDAAIAAGFDDPDFSLNQVAQAVGCSARRIRQVLDETGTSFRQEVLALRMSKARYLLASTTYLIDTVAMLAGYRCSSTFAMHVRQATGDSPRRFRLRYGGPTRAGGTTGAFRKAAQRARALADGAEAPGYGREAQLPDSAALMEHAIKHGLRHRSMRGGASISVMTEAWFEQERRWASR